MAAVEKFVLSEVQDAFGTLTPLSSTERPNVHSIRALENECITRATNIAHPDHPAMGYAGLFMDIGEYAMSDPNPYQEPANPGATPDYVAAGQNLFLNDNDRAQIKAQHAADLITWANADTVHRVLKTAIGKAIPDKWKPNLGIGQRGYGNTSARDIFVDLYDRYGIVTPSDLRSISEKSTSRGTLPLQLKNLFSIWKPSKSSPPKPNAPGTPTNSSMLPSPLLETPDNSAKRCENGPVSTPTLPPSNGTFSRIGGPKLMPLGNATESPCKAKVIMA
jgi:hypothetical protein